MTFLSCYSLLLTMTLLAAMVVNVSAAGASINVHYKMVNGGDSYTYYYIGDQPAQRCYSFTCYANEITFVEWEEMQDAAVVTFYRWPNCQGPAFQQKNSSKKFSSKDIGPNRSIHSFAVWESSMYMTRGLVDLCPSGESKSSDWSTDVGRRVSISDRVNTTSMLAAAETN